MELNAMLLQLSIHNNSKNLIRLTSNIKNTRKYPLRGYCLAPTGWRKRIMRRKNISLSGPLQTKSWNGRLRVTGYRRTDVWTERLVS